MYSGRLSGTDAQALLPASLGGISLPDLLLLAVPCYLASFADTLPLLLLDPLLAPHLSSPALWPSSRSSVLSAAHSAFSTIIPLLALDSPFLASNPLHPCIRALLTAADGSLSPAKLHAIAGRRSQHVFSTAIFSAVLTHQLLSVASPLSTTARARIRHAAAPLAHLLFTTYYVPAPSALTDTETQLLYTGLYCHRLGIALPFITPPLRRHC